MGTGKASGKGRAHTAAVKAISSPLLENMSVVGARGVLCNITGGKDLGLREISEAASVVYEQAHEDANIIIGSVIDENLKDEVIVTIIATDFERQAAQDKHEELHEIDFAPVKEEISFAAQEEHVCQPIVEEPVIEPLQLQTEVAAEDLSAVALAKEEKHEMLKHSAEFFEQADTFGCAVDSKDLDVPTFMRQK
jgi:hypothetical protein